MSDSMSEIKFDCPSCSQHFQSEEGIIGECVDCPACKTIFVVPCGASDPAVEGAPTTRVVSFQSAGSTRAVLAVAALLVTGLIIAFVLLARVGSASPQGMTQAVVVKQEPAATRSSRMVPDSLTTEMLSWLPAEPRQTILTQVGDATVNSVNELPQDGVIVFEVEFTQAGLTRSLSVDIEGNLLSVEVLESELPAAVKTVIAKEFPGAALSQIEREPGDDGKPLYAMEVTFKGQTNALTVSDAGNYWSLELEQTQMPIPVRQAVTHLWDALKITGARKTAQDGELAYEVDGEKDGRQHSLTVALNGEVLGQQDETPLELVPPAVKKAVLTQMRAEEIIRVTKVTEAGEVSYDVTAVKDGKQIEVNMSPAGKVLEDEN